MQGLTRIYAAEERKRTQSLKREAQEREQVERGVRSRVSGALGTVGRVGVQTAQAAHGLIQDARRQRAGAERTLGQAVRNAGGSERDVSQTNERVRRFVSDTGMSFEDVAQALSVGQARGSSLEAGRGETRMQAIERSLALVREANAEGAVWLEGIWEGYSARATVTVTDEVCVPVTVVWLVVSPPNVSVSST